MDLNGKVAVITGSTSGLGEALARAFAKQKTSVVVNGLDKSQLADVADIIHGISVVADVTDEQAVQGLARTAVDHYGRIDVWVNNAGIWIPYAPIEETDWKRIHQLMEVNFFGTVYGSKAAFTYMKQRRTGTIINILSIRTFEQRGGSAGYTATKFAAWGFTKTLRMEAESAGVSVIGVYPAGMQTHLFDEKKPGDIQSYMSADFVAQKIIDNLLQETPQEDLIIKQAS